MEEQIFLSVARTSELRKKTSWFVQFRAVIIIHSVSRTEKVCTIC
jgi:hypothetical protein